MNLGYYKKKQRQGENTGSHVFGNFKGGGGEIESRRGECSPPSTPLSRGWKKGGGNSFSARGREGYGSARNLIDDIHIESIINRKKFCSTYCQTVNLHI